MRVSRAIAIVLAILVAIIPIKSRAEEISVNDVDSLYRFYAWEVESTYDVSASLILSICYEESRFKTEVVGGNFTQLTNLKWFREGIDAIGARQPKDNVYENMMICGYYISKWAEEYEGEPYLWLEMWNEGYENALCSYDSQNPSRYAKRVLNRAERWEEELEIINSKNSRLHP